MSAIVSVKGLQKSIGRKHVLKGLDFDLDPGRVVGLLGPNGAGKTTLLKTLVNIYHADAGEIRIFGDEVGVGTKKYVSYLPEMNHLFDWMSVEDAIHYYNDFFDDFNSGCARELCSFLGIDPKEKVRSLSKGKTEQALIMLTFSRKTHLYLLDEPIGSIDPLARNKIIKTIFREFNPEKTVIISTHQVKDVETLLDDVLFLGGGKLVFSDQVDHIRENRGQSIEECYMEVFENA
jgi:ABC-type multidrug transport system, ATPase component